MEEVIGEELERRPPYFWPRCQLLSAERAPSRVWANTWPVGKSKSANNAGFGEKRVGLVRLRDDFISSHDGSDFRCSPASTTGQPSSAANTVRCQRLMERGTAADLARRPSIVAATQGSLSWFRECDDLVIQRGRILYRYTDHVIRMN